MTTIASASRRSAVLNWVNKHSFASVWIVLAPAVGLVLSVQSGADWIATSLAGLAGLSWSGVLLPTAVRHPAVTFAGSVAALSGGLLTLILGNVTSQHGPDTGGETGILLLSLLIAGTAAHYGQFKNHRDQRRAELELVELLTRQTERQAAAIADLRAELARDIRYCRCRRPKWWERG